MNDSLPIVAKLSDWLRRSGALSRGDITHVKIDLEYNAPISKLVFVTTTYTPDAPPDLSRHLVIKSPVAQVSDNSEIQFYREVATLLPAPPLVRCVATVEDENYGTIVLEDLRATHDHPPWPVPPTTKQSKLAIDALAQVHSKYWESPLLGKTLGKPNTVQTLTSMVKGIAAHLPLFMDAFGNSLTARGREVYQQVFASSLKPWLRLTDPRALTIIHGDAHTWNFLFPRSGSGNAYLIDWQLWHIDVGARDLAFFMALHWFPELRRERELPLLRRYHEALTTHGIANYTFDDLWLDYRLSVVRNLTIPLIMWNRGMKPEAWWRRLECALAAYNDLACEELL